MVNLKPRAKREAEGSCSALQLQRSERLRDLGKPITSSEARLYIINIYIIKQIYPRKKPYEERYLQNAHSA